MLGLNPGAAQDDMILEMRNHQRQSMASEVAGKSPGDGGILSAKGRRPAKAEKEQLCQVLCMG